MRPSRACTQTSYTLSTRICELIDGSVLLALLAAGVLFLLLLLLLILAAVLVFVFVLLSLMFSLVFFEASSLTSFSSSFSSDFSLWILVCDVVELERERTEPERLRRILFLDESGVANTIRTISSILQPRIEAAFCAYSMFWKYGLEFEAVK